MFPLPITFIVIIFPDIFSFKDFTSPLLDK